MPRTDDQFAAMRQATNEKITTTATRLFAHNGYGATSVQQIADAAGISLGLMYRHYASKEELFVALVAEGAEGLARLSDLFASDESPLALLTLWLDEVIDDLARGYDFAYYMVMMTQAVLMESNHAALDALIAENERLFASAVRLIERGQEMGEFQSGDALCYTQHLFATISGAANMRTTTQEEYLPPTRRMMLAFLVNDLQLLEGR